MLVNRIPFYYRPHERRGNGGFPNFLAFDVYFDKDLKMYRQNSSKNLKAILKKVYESGSLVEGSVSVESGKIYIEKILSFIDDIVDVKHKSVLEIGCGDGTMLIEFQKKGASVIGLEPGNHPKNPQINHIPIIDDFFPSKRIDSHFDIIFHYGVLEHVENPISFLIQQLDLLENDGKIIICVPNCEPFLNEGDISIFIHEHYNYFTSESLCNTIITSGLAIEKLSIIEGMIVASATKKKMNKDVYLSNKFSQDTFVSLSKKFQTKISALLKKYSENEIVIYVPLRALNVLYTLKTPNFRLVDDSSQIIGKYLPYFSNPVESFANILENPPKCIIIFSRTFGARIKERCTSKKELSNSDIIVINEL